MPDRYPGFFTCPTTRSIKIVCPTGIEFSKSSEAFPHAAKNCDRLAVWKSQSENFSRLAIVGKYILGIPASSATSERFFSAAGRTVTSDRCSLSEETAEDLVKIRLNLAKLAEEERVCGLGGGAAAAAVDVYRPN